DALPRQPGADCAGHGDLPAHDPVRCRARPCDDPWPHLRGDGDRRAPALAREPRLRARLIVDAVSHRVRSVLHPRARGELRARMTIRSVATALVLLVAGCQPLPHPFEDDRPPPRAPIISLRNTTSVAVPPVAGLEPDARDQLAAAMASALQDLHALARAPSPSPRRFGRLGTARTP